MQFLLYHKVQTYYCAWRQLKLGQEMWEQFTPLVVFFCTLSVYFWSDRVAAPTAVLRWRCDLSL